MSPPPTSRLHALRQVVETLLDTRLPASSLRPETLEMTAILRDSNADSVPQSNQEIERGETRTSGGLALSPTMAAMCTLDYLRTTRFLRGIRNAIIDAGRQVHDRPVRILYVGSGPYGTLAVPLMSVFSSAEAIFTLLDIHSESIESVKGIVNNLGLTQSVSEFVTTDALLYSIDPDLPPDIIIAETMQVCLESEPQVAITHHLHKEAPGAIFIPDEVRIDLKLVNPGREMIPIDRDRIDLGPLFVMNKQTVSSWPGNAGDAIPGYTVQTPATWDDKYQFMLFTTVTVYQNHKIEEYDSGLTFPRVAHVEDSITPGDTITCSYLTGSFPRLCIQKGNESVMIPD